MIEMRKTGRTWLLFFLILVLSGSLSGCGKLDEPRKVVLTTGFEKNELFRIENISCSLPEIIIYLTNTQNRYEGIYGAQIWETKLNGMTLEDNVKESVLAEIAQVKVMNLLAEKYEVTLDESEQKLVEEAAHEYFTSLSEAEAELLGVDEALIATMYGQYALADKVYHYIIKDINPEISDDEARTITVEHILLKTYLLDSDGKQLPFDDNKKQEVEKTAKEICKRAKAGEDFDQLVSEYNEDTKSQYSFGKGEMEPTFENAAFNLGTDEISDVVETSYGYHIIKCLNTFNREETDANKVKIVEQRRKEVFSQEYDAFAEGLTRKMNDEVWDTVAMIHDQNVDTVEFFQIYSKYFGKVFEH